MIFTPYERHRPEVNDVTIERVMKRDVVLSNGERFRFPNLDYMRGGRYGTRVCLVHPDDQRVASIRHRHDEIQKERAVDFAYQAWKKTTAESDARRLMIAAQALVEFMEAHS